MLDQTVKHFIVLGSLSDALVEGKGIKVVPGGHSGELTNRP